jgi:hypothetical protein
MEVQKYLSTPLNPSYVGSDTDWISLIVSQSYLEYKGKGKGKAHPITGHEGTGVE